MLGPQFPSLLSSFIRWTTDSVNNLITSTTHRSNIYQTVNSAHFKIFGHKPRCFLLSSIITN